MILGIPSVIAMLISAIYNFVDTMFIGMLNDNLAMNAVSIASPLFMIITAVG
ncbi:MAG: MATE family efflux transporter [Cellulosilyticaceae bacterium]